MKQDDMNGKIYLASVPVEIAIADVYDRVDFEQGFAGLNLKVTALLNGDLA